MIRAGEPRSEAARSVEDRLRRARELLGRSGIDGSIGAAGVDGEIAAVRADPAFASRLRTLAPDLRALGFRYVALDLTAETDPEQR